MQTIKVENIAELRTRKGTGNIATSLSIKYIP